MNLHLHAKVMRRTFVRCTVTLMMSLALAACASTAARPGPAAPAPAAAAAAQPADSERLNRKFQQAEALYLSGHLKEAAAAFEELTRAYPRDAHVWLKYGNTLTKQGSYDGAATAFQTALNLDSAQGGAAINLALVRLMQARESLDLALARVPAASPEHAQADGLERQLNSLLSPAEHATAGH
jgi:tetratricopeptide (TPR) repeat protein